MEIHKSQIKKFCNISTPIPFLSKHFTIDIYASGDCLSLFVVLILATKTHLFYRNGAPYGGPKLVQPLRFCLSLKY